MVVQPPSERPHGGSAPPQVRTLLRDDHDVDLDDPLKDEEHLTEQLETLPSLCRFQLQQVASTSGWHAPPPTLPLS